MAEVSVVTVRLRELLTDGEWHAREELIDALAGFVPPGVAWRSAERHRLSKRRRKGLSDGPRVHHTITATAVKTGRRAVVGDAIQREVRRGHVDRRRNGRGIELRWAK